MTDEIDVDELYEQAMQLLDQGDPEAALEIGEQLEAVRWTGGFEVQALALADLDRKDDAIAVLEQGLEKTGGVPWQNWSLLGNYRSDQGDYDGALAAYDSATTVEGADGATLALNRAVVLSRTERVDEALTELRGHAADAEGRGSSERIYWHFKAILVETLDQAGLGEELDALVAACGAAFAAEDENVDQSKALFAADYACALWQRGDGAGAAHWLAAALARDRECDRARWLTRERLRAIHADGGRYYRLMVEGDWPDPANPGDPQTAFFTTYFVVADDEAQALGFIQEFEPEEIRVSLKIEEAEVLEEYIDEPKGVVEVSGGYAFFDPNAPEEDED